MKPQRQYKFCINKRSLCIYFRISLNCLVLVHFLFLCSRICRVKPQYSWVPSLMVVKRCQKFQFNNKSSKKEKAEFFVCFIFSLHLEYNDSWMLKIIIVEKSYRARVINGNPNMERKFADVYGYTILFPVSYIPCCNFTPVTFL